MNPNNGIIEAEDPPSYPMSDYDVLDQQVEYPPCRNCGAKHSMGILERNTGKIDPLDLCYNCFWQKAFVYRPPKKQINLNEIT